MRIVKHWSKFPTGFVQSPSREAFKSHLSKTLNSMF